MDYPASEKNELLAVNNVEPQDGMARHLLVFFHRLLQEKKNNQTNKKKKRPVRRSGRTVVVLTLPHRYNAVRGHRTGSSNTGAENYLRRN